MQVQYDLVIDFARPNKSNTILITEGDKNSRLIHITLLSNKQPMDMSDVVTANFLGVKSDGSVVYLQGKILTDSDDNFINEVECTIPSAIADVTGNTTMTVKLTSTTGATLSSFEFYVQVRNALYNEDDYISEEDLSGYRDLLTRSVAALQKIEVMTSQEALPNPYALNVSVDGNDYAYNGSSQVNIDLDNLAHVADDYVVTESVDDSAAATATQAAQSAKTSENNAKTYMENAKTYKEGAETYVTQAQGYSTQAQGYVGQVAGYVSQIQELAPTAIEKSEEAISTSNVAIIKANTILESVDKIGQSEANAKTYMESAQAAVTSASAEVTKAAAEVTKASEEVTKAKSEVTNANAKALVSEGYALGTQNGVEVDSTSPYYHDNAKYWKEEAEKIAKTDIPIVDNLTSTQTNEALSANQGRVLNESISSVKSDLSNLSTNKQDKLVAGNNITIANNVISSSGGGIKPILNIISESDSTVTVTDGNITINPTIISSGNWSCELPNFGDWTVHAINSMGDATRTINIDTVKVYSISISHGMDITEWLSKGGITQTFSTLADILADQPTVRTLMTKHASVDYLVANGSDTENLTTILSAYNSIKWINLRDYALDTLYGNSKLILRNNGPESLTTNGITFTKHIDGSVSVVGTATQDAFYEFIPPFSKISDYGITVGESYRIGGCEENDDIVRTFLNFHAENNDFLAGMLSAKNSVATFNTVPQGTTRMYYDILVYAGKTVNTVIRPIVKLVSDTNPIADIMDTVGMYGHGEVTKDSDGNAVLKGCVPIMTSNNAPYGECFASNTRSESGVATYYPFNGVDDNNRWISNANQNNSYIGYKFVNPVKVNKVRILQGNAFGSPVTTTAKVRGSNDGTTWEVLGSVDLDSTKVTTPLFADVNNDDYYLYYSLLIDNYNITSGGYTFCGLCSLQFYGRQLSVSVPTMTSNSEPWGECIATNPSVSGEECYKAFDNNESTWGSATSGVVTDGYIGYMFTNPTCVKQISLKNANGTPNTVCLEVYDGSTWTQLGNNFQLVYTRTSINIENDSSYLGYRIRLKDTSATRLQPSILNFYGLDYSEHTERKWIYDHGVELETVETWTDNSNAYVNKLESSFVVGKASGSYHSNAYKKINLSNYNLVRMVCKGFLNYVDLSVLNKYNSTGLTSEIVAYNRYSAPIEPYNLYLDISNVDNELYLSIPSYINASEMETEVTSWWLE